MCVYINACNVFMNGCMYVYMNSCMYECMCVYIYMHVMYECMHDMYMNANTCKHIMYI